MNIIKKILTPNQKVLIRSLQHAFFRFSHRLNKVETFSEYVVIKQKYYDIFFGYYDITPFNSQDEILYVKKKKNINEVEICINDCMDLSKEKVISTSKAWNWQQGCRLRWFPGSDDKIIFNIYDKGLYGSRIVDRKGNFVKSFKYPLYDISHKGTYGLTLNFERLGVMRPGYGYTCKAYVPNNLVNETIDIIDLSTETVVDSLTYCDIAKEISRLGNYDNCYINHLSFSPNDNSFLFFWIEIKNGYHQASLLVYDITTKTIIPLETKEKVSHYVWLDNDNILCTSYKDSSICRYFVYNIKNMQKTQFCPNCLSQDGHPSLDYGSVILTDTYPDKNGYQYLYLVDSVKDTKKTIFKVYMKPVANGEMRTDLHPRFNHNNSKICFDTNINGNREILILKK